MARMRESAASIAAPMVPDERENAAVKHEETSSG